MELFLAERQNVIIRYEIRSLNYLKKVYQQYLKVGESDLKKLKSMKRDLAKRIKGYFRLNRANKFSERDYLGLRNQINLEIIRFVLNQKKNMIVRKGLFKNT